MILPCILFLLARTRKRPQMHKNNGDKSRPSLLKNRQHIHSTPWHRCLSYQAVTNVLLHCSSYISICSTWPLVHDSSFLSRQVLMSSSNVSTAAHSDESAHVRARNIRAHRAREHTPRVLVHFHEDIQCHGMNLPLCPLRMPACDLHGSLIVWHRPSTRRRFNESWLIIPQFQGHRFKLVYANFLNRRVALQQESSRLTRSRTLCYHVGPPGRFLSQQGKGAAVQTPCAGSLTSLLQRLFRIRG